MYQLMDKHRDSVKRQTSDKEEQKLLRLAGISLMRYQDCPPTDTLEAEYADRVRDEKVRPVDPRIRTETVANDLSGLRKRETFCYGSISSSHHIGTGNVYRKSGEGGRTSLCSRRSPVKYRWIVFGELRSYREMWGIYIGKIDAFCRSVSFVMIFWWASRRDGFNYLVRPSASNSPNKWV